MQNEEIVHEDVKDFMNAPEPEVKAPEPMALDDFTPAEPDHGRMTTDAIAAFASNAAGILAANFGNQWDFSKKSQELQVAWTNFIISSAANPNGYEVCREIYEADITRKWGDTGSWAPPFSKLSVQEKMPWFVFRAMVVQLLAVWAGH